MRNPQIWISENFGNNYGSIGSILWIKTTQNRGVAYFLTFMLCLIHNCGVFPYFPQLWIITAGSGFAFLQQTLEKSFKSCILAFEQQYRCIILVDIIVAHRVYGYLVRNFNNNLPLIHICGLSITVGWLYERTKFYKKK